MEEIITEGNHPNIENMDGIHTEDTTPENLNDFEYSPEKEKKGKKLPFIIGIVIGLIIGVIISPYLIEFLESTQSEKPIYKEYEKYEGENKVVYKNEALKVTITKNTNPWGEISYNAKWVNIDGYDRSTNYYSTTNILYDVILGDAEELSKNQLNWFEYMLKNIVK